jgi:hypothetical protein
MNMVKLSKQTLLAAALGLAAWGNAQAQATVSLNATPNPVNVGSTLQVSVNITGALDLYAYQFSLLFNPAVLQATGSSDGSFLAGGGTVFFVPGAINNTTGSINFTAGSLLGQLPGVNGNGTLATLNFNVTGLGASALNFADGVLVNSELGDLPSQFVNATVLAVPEPGTWLMLGLGLAAVAGAARRRST